MIKVIQVGVGPIGQRVASYIFPRKGVEIVAAVDPDPNKAGQDLGKLCAFDRRRNITVAPDLDTALQNAEPDVAVLTTISDFDQAADQAEQILRRGIHVVSTCEEMAYPWRTAPDRAQRLDQVARAHNVAVLSTGVNPGFMMDFLALTLTAVCQSVETIKITRTQDAATRRGPFQQKIGAGLTLDEFESKREAGQFGHVGLTESMHMMADRLGWQLESTEDILTPVIAHRRHTTTFTDIEPGRAAGLQQIGRAYVGGEEVITLVFRAAVGEPEPADIVEITGVRDVTSVIPGGVNGDVATCAIVINAVQSITRAQPGLRTMLDCPPIAFFS